MGNCCDTRVLPQQSTVTPFSTDDHPCTKSSLTVGSRKRRNIFTIIRNIHHQNAAVTVDTEEHQAPTCSSTQTPQNKRKAKCGDGSPSEEDEEKSSLRRVKVVSKRSRQSSPFLRNKFRRGTLLPVDAAQCDFTDKSYKGKPQDNLEVVAQCSDGAALPVDKGKGAVKMVEATSKKRRCVSAILKLFSRKRVVAPLKEKRPQVLPGTSKETAPVTTEVVPENANTAPSARGQGEPPVGMVKVETKKRRHIFSFLRGICHKTTVVPQDTQRPSVSKATSTKTTEIKTKDIPENADNKLAQDAQKHTSESIESVEERKRRRISAILKRMECKQAICPSEVRQLQGCTILSPKTRGKSDKGSHNAPEIKEIFYREEELEYLDEGSLEESQSYGINVPESRETITSTMRQRYFLPDIDNIEDTDTENAQKAVDSQSDSTEIEYWDLRNKSSTVSPVVNILLVPEEKTEDE
ncbi:uncharacterized protein LOC105245043 isoform X4 [Mus musculus]|uniref:uncharacterized protein LOC105245043 isoform X4 n=1 Tax=Mus musculus TaxID=10090 RepID=UPI0007ED3FBC|nr:uncharacterized protein LOC105245043 isoform X4 [Mus musculus]|eukprot:XP_017169215.1 PREDICTED: uncharacterized protein LOC105245043 isoform X5 [Mus musculus]